MADRERGGWLLITKQLMPYSSSGNPGSGGEPEGGNDPNETVEKVGAKK
jgi:hypothetical protein